MDALRAPRELSYLGISVVRDRSSLNTEGVFGSPNHPQGAKVTPRPINVDYIVIPQDTLVTVGGPNHINGVLNIDPGLNVSPV